MIPNCPRCGGIRCPPARGGAERGSCYCKRIGRLVVKLFREPIRSEVRIEWQGEVLVQVFDNVDDAFAALEQMRAASPTGGFV